MSWTTKQHFPVTLGGLVEELFVPTADNAPLATDVEFELGDNVVDCGGSDDGVRDVIDEVLFEYEAVTIDKYQQTTPAMYYFRSSAALLLPRAVDCA